MSDLKYHILDTLDDVPNYEGELVFDLETTSLNTHNEKTRIVTIGLCWEEGEAWSVMLNKYITPETFEVSKQYWKELKKLEKRFLNNPKVKIMGHNVKYDIRVCHAHKLKSQPVAFDSMLASYCLTCDRLKIDRGKASGGPSGHSLDDVCLHYLNHVKIRTKSILGKKKRGQAAPTMLDADPEISAFYCCEDVDWTLRAINRLKSKLEEEEHASKLFYEIEMPCLAEVIIPMECNGVHINKKVIKGMLSDYGKRKQEVLSHLSDIAGEEIESTLARPQLEHIIYDMLKVPEEFGLEVVRTASGARSTSASTLSSMVEHPFVEGLLTAKSLDKLLSTYLNPLLEKISALTGLLHASFLQHITSTGRLASRDPNLQNIPQRTELGRQIRKAFTSRFPGGQILAADWSQCELRIMAHIAKEDVFIDIFKNGRDAHTAVAALLGEIEESEVSSEQRTKAKTMNFGMLYQMGAKKLAEDTGMTVEEATDFIKRYLGKMKGVARYREDQKQKLKQLGYVETLFGRRRYLSKIHSQENEGPQDIKLKKWVARSQRNSAIREGGNHPIQGTNADICKIAMLKIQREITKQDLKSLIILQVHDEVVLDVPKDELHIMKDIVEEIMQNVVKLVVPLVCDGEYADSWEEAH